MGDIMFKRFFVCITMLLAASAASAAQLADMEAKRLATEMANVLTEARNRINKMIKDGNPAGYETIVRAPIMKRLDAWPDRSLDGRAIFPYFSCKEAAIFFVQYGDAWALPSSNKSLDKMWREKKGREFRESHDACAAALKNPDMSLKDIQ